ncbi:lysophospholipid acyltransferase family protein [Parasphingorhabdus litoris]|uniref:Lysophospholipid acyltransferase family protein n=1 Tax=Parasphingorhabdus litoris TaxID=394733 RepID=A0ABN1AG49_9SPHN|nr:lysophospholipid acyltransferase family protein [Parasphingorhabdus litoris]
MLAAIRSIIFIPLFYGGSTPIIILAFLVALFSVRGTHFMAKLWSQYHYLCARLILGIRVEIKGEIRNESLLYVFKHESMFETIDLLRIFDKPVVIAKKELLVIPLWGWIAKKHGLLGIDRNGGGAAMRQIIKQAKRAKAEGRPIVIFAEGSRAHHGERPELQTGFAGIYKLMGLPLVPVALDSGLVSPRDTFVQNSGVITYEVQPEIEPGLDRDDIRDRVHEAINKLND